MKLTGETFLPAPRPAVFAKLSDARFFAACVEGISDIVEVGPDHFTGTLEISVALVKLRFAMALRTLLAQQPVRVDFEAQGSAGAPLGGLTVATSTLLLEERGGTRIRYEIDVRMPGKLVQPILRAKARAMERQFIAGLTAGFAAAAA